MTERLSASVGSAFRKSALGLLVIGLAYFRGGTGWHVFSIALLIAALVGWSFFVPRALLLDADGLTLVYWLPLVRRKRIAWRDVNRFDAYTPLRGPTYVGWYVQHKRPRWWTFWAPAGGVQACFRTESGGDVLQPEQLANLLNDRRSHALGLTREAPIDDAVEALFHRF